MVMRHPKPFTAHAYLTYLYSWESMIHIGYGRFGVDPCVVRLPKHCPRLAQRGVVPLFLSCPFLLLLVSPPSWARFLSLSPFCTSHSLFLALSGASSPFAQLSSHNLLRGSTGRLPRCSFEQRSHLSKPLLCLNTPDARHCVQLLANIKA
jgi:hypothetical protein